jgi:fatty acid desaturase
MVIQADRDRITARLRDTRKLFALLAVLCLGTMVNGGFVMYVVLFINSLVYITWVFDLTHEIRLIDDKLKGPE